MTTHSRFVRFLLLAAVSAAACSDDDGGVAVVTVDGTALLFVGTSAQFDAATVNGFDSGYAWESTDPTVAFVDGSGNVTALAEGEAEIRAVGNLTGAAGSHPVVVTLEAVPGLDQFQEWAGSPHADRTAEAFMHWDEDGEVPATCAKCHSTPGFRDFLGDDGTAAGVVDGPAPLGTVIDCSACHNDAARALDDVTFPSGAVVPLSASDPPLGREAVCMSCHQGRESTDSVNAALAAAAPGDDDEVLPDQGFINVHYFPAAATRYGGIVRGGYLYDDKQYDTLFRHVPEVEACQDCHDPHTLEIRVDVCAGCHNVSTVDDLHDIRMQSSVTRDYDGDGNTFEGIYHEIATLRQMLLTAVQRYAAEVVGTPLAYDEARYPYWIQDTNGNGVADADERTRYTTFTARLIKATFNFQYATKDPGGFAHNGKFIIQLLHDSIEDLNAVLSNPVDLSAADRNDSGHFDGTAEAFRHWDEDGFVQASCARCHSASPGFEQFLTFGATIEQPIANGFDCAVCHTTFDTFETRRVVQVEFPSGKKTPAIGDAVPTNDPLVQSNLCMTCHQGRTSKQDIDDAIAAGKLSFQDIHYLAAGATLYGADAAVGYEYEGKTYADKFDHVGPATNTGHCVFCHSPVNTQHTFLPQDNIDQCRLCHSLPNNELTDIRVNSTADYDGDGLYPGSPSGTEPLRGEVQTMAAALLAEIQAYASGTLGSPLAYAASRYPYFVKDTNGNGVADADERTRYSDWDELLVKAAHNYQHSQREPGAWAHNFAYIVQLLYDSIDSLGGDVSAYTRP